jgi:hypothetical protein
MTKQKARHPLRRAGDPGGGTDSFSTFRSTLAWLIPTCAALLLGLMYLMRGIAEGIVNAHEAVEQKELNAKIDSVRGDLGARMTTQWATFYTKNEIDERRKELDRRYDETRTWMLKTDQAIANEATLIEQMKARQDLQQQFQQGKR